MASTLISSAPSVVSDTSHLGDSSNSFTPATTHAGASDMSEKDAKYAYAVVNGMTNILRINIPTPGCRK